MGALYRVQLCGVLTSRITEQSRAERRRGEDSLDRRAARGARLDSVVGCLVEIRIVAIVHYLLLLPNTIHYESTIHSLTTFHTRSLSHDRTSFIYPVSTLSCSVHSSRRDTRPLSRVRRVPSLTCSFTFIPASVDSVLSRSFTACSVQCDSAAVHQSNTACVNRPHPFVTVAEFPGSVYLSLPLLSSIDTVCPLTCATNSPPLTHSPFSTASSLAASRCLPSRFQHGKGAHHYTNSVATVLTCHAHIPSCTRSHSCLPRTNILQPAHSHPATHPLCTLHPTDPLHTG